MNRFYTSVLFIALVLFSSAVSAQDATEYYNKAKKFINKSKLDSANFYLAKAIELSPNNIEMLEDLLYVQYLDRDFAKAILLGQNLVQRPDASVKAFQLLGMTYKDIADFKEAKKVYEKAIVKFPTSGVVYNEYGDLYSQMQKPSDAIKMWEKGIEVDPSFSSNYYFATTYYASNKNPIWALIYGETFVNIESLSDRTREVKEMLTELYKKISVPKFLNVKNNAFAEAIAATFAKQSPVPAKEFSIAAITLLRTNFINDWNKENTAKFPFKLYEYQNQLIKEGLFEAYNQWLFASNNYDAYASWKQANNEKQAAFEKFVGGRVYKVPAGQYYQSK